MKWDLSQNCKKCQVTFNEIQGRTLKTGYNTLYSKADFVVDLMDE
ncbi:hypothetical protein GPAL_1045 [Glaciecola pallidula DSM 14239 = ACAM 615]|uniref:Uncharacterized protein n=1 Tax=Brumicola pallidula DSM 14239 = ACAM 615 TaxID=1121922 RepID=K6Y562_9ALTE|nr:hypothetical protein GPAL_1045 [Glaciecola pallidula DSM 14239 = ACAM 615]